uniref:Uncharacterized protein n=1 Tax=Grammatophora oceanica TaxID=210454 RepID=A0A7S1UZC1_9STRA
MVTTQAFVTLYFCTFKDDLSDAVSQHYGRLKSMLVSSRAILVEHGVSSRGDGESALNDAKATDSKGYISGEAGTREVTCTDTSNRCDRGKMLCSQDDPESFLDDHACCCETDNSTTQESSSGEDACQCETGDSPTAF